MLSITRYDGLDSSQLPGRKQLLIGSIFLFLHIPVSELRLVLGGTACFDSDKFDGHILLHNPDPLTTLVTS